MIVVGTNIFPVPDLGNWDYTWPIKRTPTYSNVKQVPANRVGEVHINLSPFVEWQWDLDVAFIKGDGKDPTQNSAWHRIVGFIGRQRGSFQSWYYSDPYDNGVDSNNNVIVNHIGPGDGVTTLYQTVRFIQGMSDLIQNYASTPVITLNGFVTPFAGYSAPATPTLGQTAGGSIGATTYFVKITFVTLSGETLPSGEASFAVSANNLLVVTSPTTPDPNGPLMGYNVYVSTTTGTETLQNSTPILFGTNWTEPTSGLIVGSALTVANTTGWTLDVYGSLTFAGPPKATVDVAWAAPFYFRCFFNEDEFPLQTDLKAIWSIRSLKFHSTLR